MHAAVWPTVARGKLHDSGASHVCTRREGAVRYACTHLDSPLCWRAWQKGEERQRATSTRTTGGVLCKQVRTLEVIRRPTFGFLRTNLFAQSLLHEQSEGCVQPDQLYRSPLAVFPREFCRTYGDGAQLRELDHSTQGAHLENHVTDGYRS